MYRPRLSFRQFLCALALGSMLSSSVMFGQTPAPAANAGAQPQQQDEVLRISTDLVQTDIVVLDKQGRAVNDLQRDQFELLVDGQPQPIAFFESVMAGSAREAAQLAAARGATVAPVSSSSTAAPSRTLIFFVDDLHLSQPSIQRTREMLTRFVNELGPTDQALIVSPSGQIGFLQQLSNNKAALLQAISRINYQMGNDAGRRGMTVYQARAIDQGQRDVLEAKVKELMDDTGVTRNPMDPDQGISGDFGTGGGNNNNPSNSSTPGAANSSVNNTVVMSTNGPRGASGMSGSSGQVGGTNLTNRRAAVEAQVKSVARNVLLQAQAVNQALLSGLENVARGASTLPGRKLLFYISDGVILDTKNGDLTERLRRVIDASSRSGVVIYAVDSRGLTADGASASVDSFSDIAGSVPSNTSAADSTSMALAENRQSKEVLQTLASETGGRAILNRNDLETGIRKVLDETAAYYVLAWKPQPAETGGPKFKTIKINIKGRPELTVRSRRGFYTAPLPAVATAASPAAASGPEAAKAAETELRRAISDPFPRRDLSLQTYHTFTNTPPGEYKLTTFTDITGYQTSQNSELDVAMVVLDSNGKPVTNFARKLKVTPSGNAAQPVKFVGTFPNALAPGLYQVRSAVRDALTGRTGTLFDWVEIPEFKPGKLTLSSLFLSDDKAGGDSADKSKGTPNVTRNFSRASTLVLQYYIYNAAPAASGKPDVESAITLMSNGQTLTSSPLPPVAAEGMKDPARLFHSAQFPLEGFPVGTYTLQIKVTDKVTKNTATQQVNFTVR